MSYGLSNKSSADPLDDQHWLVTCATICATQRLKMTLADGGSVHK